MGITANCLVTDVKRSIRHFLVRGGSLLQFHPFPFESQEKRLMTRGAHVSDVQQTGA